MATFSGSVAKVLFKRTKDGREVQILFAGVVLEPADRDKLLALQEADADVEVTVIVKPNPQLGIDAFADEDRPTFGPTLVRGRKQ